MHLNAAAIVLLLPAAIYASESPDGLTNRWDTLENSRVNLSGLGLTLIEGDMAVRFIDWLQSGTGGNESGEGDDSEQQQQQQQRKGTPFIWRRWPRRTVYYDFHSSVNDQVKGIILQSIAHWEEMTCLTFTRRSRANLWYINFRTDNDGCWSLVGMEPLGPQDLNIGPGCEHTSVVIHEIGHAIGFFHEQSRLDRDGSILILWENVPRDKAPQFAQTYENSRGVPYDVTSIMQYSQGAFSPQRFEKNTIVTLDPHMQLRLGGDGVLSFRDRKLANLMYSCPDLCPNSRSTECENEGFLFQSKDADEEEPCSCVCPSNTVGDHCEELRGTYYGDPLCGGNVTEAGEFIETPGFPNRNVDYKGCTWWIQAPVGQVPRLTFEEFSIEPRLALPEEHPASAYNGQCARERLEVRTRDRFHGKMYCGNEIKPNETLTAQASEMVLILGAKRTNTGKGFRARVDFVDKATGVSGIVDAIAGAISVAENFVQAQMTGR